MRWGALCLCLASAWFFLRHRQVRSGSLIAFALYGFCLWLVANNIVVSPSYTASAPFHAAILAMAFALGRRLDPANRDIVLRGLCGITLVLAVIAIWEIGWSGKGIERAHSVFLTPATMATVINLSLLPAIAFALWSEKWRAPAVVVVLLVCALLLTVSRGGLLGFCGGLLAMSVLARLNGFAFGSRELLVLSSMLAGGWVLSELVQWAGHPPLLTHHAGTSGANPAVAYGHAWLGDASQASSVSRLELYAIAIDALRVEPFWGIGYLGYQALLEARRDLLPSFVGLETSFTHNDYLQILAELGALGLVLLLSTIVLAALRAADISNRSRDRLVLDIALLGAIASMSTHALVDFPFYVSYCLLLYGLAVGLLDQPTQETHGDRNLASLGAVRRLLGVGIAAGYIVVLAPPAIAEVAAGTAHHAWRTGNAQSAAYWFEVARRFSPRDWRYHWSAGNFWYLQALEVSSPVAAGLADEAFAAGVQADPRTVRNLLGRIDTHRGLRHLLETPADEPTLRAWLEKATSLSPMDPAVQAEARRTGSRGLR